MAKPQPSAQGRVLILAEVGSVHDGSFGNAGRLIAAAAQCGADAVKFQTHIAQAETLPDAPMPPFFKGEPRFQYFERTGFTLEQWRGLKAQCVEQGVEFVSSPFSIEAVDLLEEVGVARYKIPSGEVTNLPLLKAVAATGKPAILSSGMSSWAELDRAVETMQGGAGELTVLQCTSEYPCPYEQVGLNVMLAMRERYGLPVGLSDHTLTSYASLAAVTLGATVIEKHFTFSRLMYGSDAAHSLEPAEFTDLVQGVRAVQTMLVSPVDKDHVERYGQMKLVFQKSVVSLKPIARGDTFTTDLLGVKKPGTGLAPGLLAEIIGLAAARDIPAGRPLVAEDVQWPA
jgi:N-acetylneuraminate synthase